MDLSRRENGMRKDKERARRDKRMREIIQASKFPYTPAVMSWLSAQLDRPSSLIQPADVEKFLAKKE
jgi:hypothetical protein